MSADVMTETNPRDPERTSTAEAGSEATTAAGRGGLAIAIAKVSFILFGFGQTLVLPAILGTDGYGVIARILATVGIVNNVVVGLSIQGVSRTVARVSEAEAPGAFRRVLVMHGLLAVVVACAFAASAGLVANLLEAPYIANGLRVMALVVFFYGIYAPLVGALNGRRRFVDQASLDIAYGVLRFATTIGGALVAIKVLHGDGVFGGVVGFTIAAGLIVPLALTRSKTGAPGATSPSAREYGSFLAPTLVGLVSLNLLLQTDFELFSHFVGQKATALGEPARRADEIVGVYRAFQLFSFLPYQLLMSVTFVLFPLLARAHADGDRAAVKRYTETGVRLALLVVGLLAGIVAAIPYALLRFAFKDPSIAALGAGAQPIHALAMGAFALLGVATTALTSLKRERIAAVLTTTGVFLVAGACAVLVPRADLGTPMMMASASGTLLAIVLVATAGGFVLYRVAGGLTAPLTALRVLAATAACILVGSRLPYFGRPTALVEALVVAAVYVGVLVVTRELGGPDLALVRSLAGRRGSSGAKASRPNDSAS